MEPRRPRRIHSAIAAVLLVAICALLAWLSTRYHHTADWTSNGRHTLSEASAALLAEIKGPVEITGYARPDAELRGLIADLIERFRRKKPDIRLRFVDPNEAPDEIRSLAIQTDGELVVRYASRTEHVEEHTEEALANALQRLMRGGERYVVFLEGHGERGPFGDANHDLGQLGDQLAKRGLKVQALNLAGKPAIPDNTSVLVIASPEVAYLPREAQLVSDYLKGGGNLLWLIDPGPLQGLDPLAAALGLEPSPGTLVDPATAIFGIDHPAIVPVTSYPAEEPVAGFRYLTVFPFAREVKAAAKDGWQAAALLSSGKEAWAETGKLEGELGYDEGGDRKGPLDIGLKLSRPRTPPAAPDHQKEPAPPEQRVAVIGDGDFLSNSYLGNSGNLDLGLKIINWLASDEALIAVPAGVAVDQRLDLSDTEAAVISVWFLMLLPAALGGMGFFVWWRRRRA
jgi:ABC-type uncharacterized transport system involved in gliding motility auxiliary subunit